MASLERITRRIVQVCWAVRLTPWLKLWRARDPRANTVIWVHHRFPESWPAYLLREETILKDLALLSAVARAGIPLRIVTGKSIGAETNARILYSIDQFNPIGAQNYSAALVSALEQLEAQGNELFPPIAAARLWENKVFMHERFEQCGIRAPHTVAVGRGDSASEAAATANMSFPLLAKEPHSCNSAGVHKVDSEARLDELWADLVSDGHSDLLLQSLIQMSADMRVIVIGDEIVLHFMRTNRDKDEWQPTSIQKRSDADYEVFPEQWRDTIVDSLATLGLTNGAFDICWADDDTTTSPYFLEVSPAYHPSPSPPPRFVDVPYSEFMQQMTGPDSYPRAFVTTIFDLQVRALRASSII